MTDAGRFLAAVLAAPDDDTPRLVFADWLDEHGRPETAVALRTPSRWGVMASAAVEMRFALPAAPRTRWLVWDWAEFGVRGREPEPARVVGQLPSSAAVRHLLVCFNRADPRCANRNPLTRYPGRWVCSKCTCPEKDEEMKDLDRWLYQTLFPGRPDAGPASG